MMIQSNGPVSRPGEQRAHAIRREQLRRVRRRAAGGDRQQVRIVRALHHFAHARLAGEQLRQAAIVGHAQRLVHARAAACRRRSAARARRRRPAPSRCSPPSSSCLRAAASWRRPRRAAPLPGSCAASEVRIERYASPKSCGTGPGDQRMAIAGDDRHQAEELQLQPARDVVGRLDGVVEIVDAERDAEAERQAERDRIGPVAAMVRRERLRRAPRARSTTRTLLVRLLATTRSSFSRVSSWL